MEKYQRKLITRIGKTATKNVTPQPSPLTRKAVVERLPGSRQVSIMTIKNRVRK